MRIQEEITIQAPRNKVWQIISDIESSAGFITGIEKVEILEKPENSLVGLKWEETRILFGKTATEVMWITDVDEGFSYKTRADGPGVVYISSLNLVEEGNQTRLTMGFESEILSLGTKILSAIMGLFFNKATKDAIKQDLVDIKSAAES
jgi:carbon monoxide dehydrogenase subunit G